MQDEFFASSEYQILSDFNSETSKTTEKYRSFCLFRNSFDSHSANVSTPSIFHYAVIDVDLFCGFFLFFLIFFDVKSYIYFVDFCLILIWDIDVDDGWSEYFSTLFLRC